MSEQLPAYTPQTLYERTAKSQVVELWAMLEARNLEQAERYDLESHWRKTHKGSDRSDTGPIGSDYEDVD